MRRGQTDRQTDRQVTEAESTRRAALLLPSLLSVFASAVPRLLLPCEIEQENKDAAEPNEQKVPVVGYHYTRPSKRSKKHKRVRE